MTHPTPASRHHARRAYVPVLLNRRQLNSVLLVGALAGPQAAANAQPAPESPQDAYRVSDFDWIDPVRGRAVPARLYWPATASPEAPVPLVVFSHGIGGSRQGYSYLGRHWSSQGIASLHVQHVGSDSALWRGNPFGVIGRLQAAAQESEAIARVADLRFALDQLLADEAGGHGPAVDRRRIVAAGHSYGANTTLMAIGARVVRDGRVVECMDPRFSAAVIVSAPPFYGESDLAAVLGRVRVPTVHVTATEDVIQIPGYHSGFEDRVAIFDAIGAQQKLLAVFRGGSHSMFTDRGFTGGVALNPKVKRATAELSSAFFDLVFAGDGGTLARWQDTWQPLLARAPRSVPAPASVLPMTESSADAAATPA